MYILKNFKNRRERGDGEKKMFVCKYTYRETSKC
jgi:hypothetical protein